MEINEELPKVIFLMEPAISKVKLKKNKLFFEDGIEEGSGSGKEGL